MKMVELTYYLSKVKASLSECDTCSSAVQHPTRPETLRVRSAYGKPEVIDVTVLPTTALFTTPFLIFEGYIPLDYRGDKAKAYRVLKQLQCQLEWVNRKPAFKKHRELDYLAELEPIEYDGRLAEMLMENKSLIEGLISLTPKLTVEIPKVSFEVILYDGLVPSKGVQVGDYFDHLSRSEVRRIAYPYLRNPKEIKWLLYLRIPMVEPLRKNIKTLSTALKVLYEASKTVENLIPP